MEKRLDNRTKTGFGRAFKVLASNISGSTRAHSPLVRSLAQCILLQSFLERVISVLARINSADFVAETVIFLFSRTLRLVRFTGIRIFHQA